MEALSSLSRNKKWYLGIIIVVVIVIIALAAYLSVERPAWVVTFEYRAIYYVDGLFGIHNPLVEATYLLAPESGGRLYSPSDVAGFTSHDWDLDSQSYINDYSHSGSNQAAVIVHSNTNMVEVSFNGTPIVDSLTFKRATAISPSGSYVAYSEQNTASASINPTDWSFVVVNAQTGKEVQRVPGFGGFFLTDTSLLVFNASGIESLNLSDGKTSPVFTAPFSTIVVPMAQSTDRNYIAFTDPQLSLATVFKVTLGTSGPKLSPVFSQVMPATGSLAVTDTALYSVSLSHTASSQIWEYSFDRKIHGDIFQFTKGIHVTEIVM